MLNFTFYSSTIVKTIMMSRLITCKCAGRACLNCMGLRGPELVVSKGRLSIQSKAVNAMLYWSEWPCEGPPATTALLGEQLSGNSAYFLSKGTSVKHAESGVNIKHNKLYKSWIVFYTFLFSNEKYGTLAQKTELFEDVAPLLWNSGGTIAALLQEIVSIYPVLSTPYLTLVQSNRVCNALTLLQVFSFCNVTYL
ncbi:hypothetical protein AgCh_014306 [Apium graveolens]